LTIPNNPSGTSVPNATVGTAYSYQLPVSGGAQPYTCILEQFGVGGPLPAGLSLSGCVISGTPTTAAPYAPFYIAVTDASGASLQPVLFIIKAQ
jgi:hypothetical protein